MNSEAYTEWEDYLDKHPQLKNVPSAEILQTYEEEMIFFILGLFK